MMLSRHEPIHSEEALQAEGLSKYYDSREEKHDTSAT